MSNKTKFKAARAMPVEAILTRNKVAQLKQNKLHHNVKLIDDNEFLKVTNRKPKISEKNVKLKEFQPEKVKRKVKLRKVVLIPKPNHTIVADMTKCNKRKLNVPKKDLSQSNSTMKSQRSKEELIPLMDGTQELCDDDFLEILTCPSPVWWEDPPPGYTEESISAEFVKKEYLDIENKDSESNTMNKKKFLNVDKMNDINYVNKSKKLENLLGNIKNKKNNSKVCDSIRNVLSDNEFKENVATDKYQKEEFDKLSDNHSRIRASNSPICIELNSDETDQEDTMNVSLDDNTLLFLENIEIPIVNK